MATLDNTVGAAYLGVIGSSILFGITNLQAYIYYHRYSRDWYIHKVSVGLLWALDTFHLGLTTQIVYHYLVTGFGNLIGLLMVVWTFKLQIGVNIIIICLVQSLYAVRVWKLGSRHNKIIPILVWVIVVAGYGVGLILFIETYKISTFPELDNMAWAVYTSFAMSTFVDIVITSSMFFYLRKSRTSFSTTNSKIASLIFYTLSSGLVTSACSLSALITYSLMPDNLVFMGIEFLLTKLYINSYFAMLNARSSIRDKSEDGLTLSLNLRSGGSGHGGTSSGNDPDKNAISLSPMSPREMPTVTVVSGGAPAVSTDNFDDHEGKTTYSWPV